MCFVILICFGASIIHVFGDITILLGLLFSHAPHHEKEEFAIILCLHKLIKYMSHGASFFAWLHVINVCGQSSFKLFLAHSISSENIKRCMFLTLENI